MIVNSDQPQGGSTTDQSQNTDQTASKQTDESKEFSRALAKRAAEIEAKYSDYADLKAKATKYDEGQEATKSEAQKLQERLVKAEAERDALKKTAERDKLVQTIAEETGLDRKVVSMLSGDDKTLAENAKALKDIIGKQQSSKQGKPPLPPAVPPNHGNRQAVTAKQLLSQAYAEK
jgi:regulator of replication initiation timing